MSVRRTSTATTVGRRARDPQARRRMPATPHRTATMRGPGPLGRFSALPETDVESLRAPALRPWAVRVDALALRRDYLPTPHLHGSGAAVLSSVGRATRGRCPCRASTGRSCRELPDGRRGGRTRGHPRCRRKPSALPGDEASTVYSAAEVSPSPRSRARGPRVHWTASAGQRVARSGCTPAEATWKGRRTPVVRGHQERQAAAGGRGV